MELNLTYVNFFSKFATLYKFWERWVSGLNQ